MFGFDDYCVCFCVAGKGCFGGWIGWFLSWVRFVMWFEVCKFGFCVVWVHMVWVGLWVVFDLGLGWPVGRCLVFLFLVVWCRFYGLCGFGVFWMSWPGLGFC